MGGEAHTLSLSKLRKGCASGHRGIVLVLNRRCLHGPVLPFSFTPLLHNKPNRSPYRPDVPYPHDSGTEGFYDVLPPTGHHLCSLGTKARTEACTADRADPPCSRAVQENQIAKINLQRSIPCPPSYRGKQTTTPCIKETRPEAPCSSSLSPRTSACPGQTQGLNSVKAWGLAFCGRWGLV